MTGCQTPLPSSHSTVIKLVAGRPANLAVMALELQPLGQDSEAMISPSDGFVTGVVLVLPVLVVVLFVVVLPVVVVLLFEPTTALAWLSTCIGRTVICRVTPSVAGRLNGELMPHAVNWLGWSIEPLSMIVFAPLAMLVVPLAGLLVPLAIVILLDGL